jgi:molecular chaperone DnaJ
MGTEIEVPTLDGKANLRIPAGTQPGEILRMRGQGVPTRGSRRGDQLVVVQVMVPKKIGKRQEELLRELGDLDAESAEHKGFFDKLKAMFG